MPTNLNALIRYKEIDKCLSNHYNGCTIDALIDKCSEALGEYRGVYKRISERTIRDDIRVMRSDILGFNAPIIFRDGYYYYEKSDYTIFRTSIEDFKILEQVLNMLIDERKNIKDTEIDNVILSLSELTGIKIPKVVLQDIAHRKEQIINADERFIADYRKPQSRDYEEDATVLYSKIETPEKSEPDELEDSFAYPATKPDIKLSWVDIFRLLD